MSHAPRRYLWQLLLFCPAVAGCSSSSVEGEVTLNGTPLSGALVRYVPQDSGGVAAEGTTDAKGMFRLATAGGEPVRPGAYRIVVRKEEIPPVDPTLSPEQRMEARRLAMQQPRKSLVPTPYTAAETTPLAGTVPPTGRVRLELTGP